MNATCHTCGAVVPRHTTFERSISFVRVAFCSRFCLSGGTR